MVVFTLLIFTIPSLSLAAAGRPGPYFSGFLGTSFATDTRVTNSDSLINDKVSFDPGAYVGGTGGYDFGFLRLEGELSYRHAKIDKVTESNGFRFSNVDGDLGVFASMFNVFLDMHNPSRVTPYVGGGIGFATLYLNDIRGFDSRGPGRVRLYDDSNDTVFASQVGAGIDVAINSRFSLDFGYRYFITEKANFDSNVASPNSLRFESHNAMVGFKVKF
jgi:outer membrane autotransporter protein